VFIGSASAAQAHDASSRQKRFDADGGAKCDGSRISGEPDAAIPTDDPWETTSKFDAAE
jgi:hypothetical protein